MSEQYPLITVGIPSRNEGVWIKHTLSSLQKNTVYPNYDVIVCDDASIDGSCDNLEKQFPDLPLKVIRVKQDEKHGTSISRHRMVLESKGEIFETNDAHMIFPHGWLTKFYEVHKLHPDAFLQAASTDIQSANVINSHSLGTDLEEDALKKIIDEWKEKLKGKAFYISRTWTEDKAYGEQHVWTKLYGVPIAFHADGIKKKNTPVDWILHELDDTVNPEYPGLMAGYGAYLDYDVECHNMIHPTWNPYYNRDYPPKSKLLATDGIMGAAYMFPKDLLLERLGGWLPIEGWIEEEPWLCMAAKITGIPIYCVTDLMIVHLYERPPMQVSNRNTYSKNINSKLITEILFNEYKIKVQKGLFKKAVDPAELKDYKPLLDERKTLIETHRVMNDGEFLIKSNLMQYFDNLKKDEMRRRLGSSDLGLKNAGYEDITKFMTDLVQNPRVVWDFHLVCVNEKTGGTIKHFAVIEANDFDWQKGCRDHTKNGYNRQIRWEMSGRVFEYLTGFTSAHFLSEHFGLRLEPTKEKQEAKKIGG